MRRKQLDELCLELPAQQRQALLLRLAERTFPGLTEMQRRDLLVRLIGQATGGEKTASMVHF